MHEIEDLDPKGLRDFALVTGGIVVFLFGILLPWLMENSFPLWPWILAAILAAWGLLHPSSLQPVYRAWMRFGLLLSRITTPLILGLVFYGLILPMGLIMRIAGRDPMARKVDRNVTSYRVASHKAPKENMERPF